MPLSLIGDTEQHWHLLHAKASLGTNIMGANIHCKILCCLISEHIYRHQSQRKILLRLIQSLAPALDTRMHHSEIKEKERTMSWGWPSVRVSGTHNDQRSKNGQNNMGETGGCKSFMSGGLYSNRTSVSMVNFIILF